MAPRVVIATPLAGSEPLCSSVSQGYSEHVRALSHELGAVQVVSYSGSHVHARNRLAHALLRNFLTEPTDVVLWWDSDQWPEQRELAAQMLATGEDFIAAPTTTKERRAKFTHRAIPGAQQDGDTLEVAGVGFGYTMTTRRCLAAVSDAAEVYLEDANAIPNCFGHMYHAVDGGRWLLGEDFSFCQRWRDLGGKVKLYLNAGIMHHAGQRSFTVRDIPGANIEEAPPAMAAE